MTTGRVTADDLALAASWLREYNDGLTTDPTQRDEVEDPTAVTMQKVAAWLEAEVERREVEAEIRLVIQRVEEGGLHRANPAKVREFVLRKRAERKAS